MKFTVLTLGCKTNQAESTRIERKLCESGHKVVDFKDKPDICIINTCSVTAKAEQQSRQLINKSFHNDIRVIVTGCYSELNYEKLKHTKPAIEIVRNKDKDNILKKIKVDSIGIIEDYSQPRHRPAVKVQDGCSNACSYCVIPMTRGRSISLPIDEIMGEISYYETMNYKEVVLTGIHLGAYGADLTPKVSLSRLLKTILNKTLTIRIRLSSIEVKEIDDELLEVLSDRRICRHLHIPLQSGDNRILMAMNRTYSVEDYLRIINKILYILNDTSLGTDVMVGFPGEKELEFRNTQQMLEDLQFSYLHVFSFSPRPGTNAAIFPEQVNEEIKKERSLTLRTLGELKKRRYIESNIGKIKQVIIESKTAKGFTGTTEDYLKVFLPPDKGLEEGMLAKIRLGRYDNGRLIGIPLSILTSP